MPPQRATKLFSLSRIANGDGLDESLLSYLLRLAEHHCVRVGTLLAAVAPRTLGQKRTLAPAKIEWLMGSSPERRPVLQELAEAFSAGSSDLGTMELFCGLTGDVCFRRFLKWCPRFLTSHRIAYYPLLWYIDAVRVSPTNGYALRSLCHDCGLPQPVVTAKSWVGECAHCGAQLEDGAKVEPEPWDPVVCGTRSPLYERWVADQTRAFIVLQSSNRERETLPLADTLLWWLSNSGYSIRESARMLGIGVDDLSRWICSNQLPKLGTVLEICWMLGIGLVDFVRRHPPAAWKGLQDYQLRSIPPRFATEVANFRKVDELKRFLHYALGRRKHCHESLVEVCMQRFGVSTSVAYRHCPDLACQISQQFHKSGRSREEVKESMADWEMGQIRKWLKESGRDASLSRIAEHHSNPTMLGRR